jgi:hypothetical protein
LDKTKTNKEECPGLGMQLSDKVLTTVQEALSAIPDTTKKCANVNCISIHERSSKCSLKEMPLPYQQKYKNPKSRSNKNY